MRRAATGMSALSVTMTGLLPPSSRQTGVRYFAALCMTTRPTAGEPVKKMKSNRSSSSALFSSRPPSTTAMYSGSNVSPSSFASARLVAGA